MSRAVVAGATEGVDAADMSVRPELIVPMQDLQAHHAPLLAQLGTAAARVLASGRFVIGAGAPEVEAFERDAAATLSVSHAVGVSSGTDALLVMLMAAGVGPGDEVVTTPFSFIATATAIARLGARPVFADVESRTLTLDPDAAIARIGARTKAVLTVHLFGRVARTGPLETFCEARGISLLEDAAQAIGAVDDTGRWVGAIGRAAALSFFPTKNLGGFGDGGMVLTNDTAFADQARLLRGHGATRKFHHAVVGGNFRLDELQAALLRVKLPHLPDWTAARRRIAGLYRSALSDTPLGLPPEDGGCVWNQFVVSVPGGRRDFLAAHLLARGIATGVYYPGPLHLQPCFASLGHRPGDFPVAEQACRDALALPMYPELSGDQIRAVTNAIRAALEEGPAPVRRSVTAS